MRPALPGSGDACGQLMARAVFALLRLDRLVIHVHAVLDRRHILVPQRFPQTERVIAQRQVPDGEGMAVDVRADALLGDARPLPDALEEQRGPILGERQARLGEEGAVLIGASHSTCSSSSGRYQTT